MYYKNGDIYEGEWESGNKEGKDDCFKIFRSSSHDGEGKSGYLFAAVTVRDKRLLVESIMSIKMSASLAASEAADS